MGDVDVLSRCRDGAAYIERMLADALNQTGVDLRVLVVDDASRDDSANRIRSFGDPRVMLIENLSPIGEARCLNLLLRRASAPYVVTVPDDGYLLPGALQRLVEILERSPRIGQAWAGAFRLTAAGTVKRAELRRNAQMLSGRAARCTGLEGVLAFGAEGLGPVGYRRAALEAIGGFAEELVAGAQIEATFRLAPRNEVVVVPELLCACGRTTLSGGISTPSLARRLFWYRRSAARHAGRVGVAVAAIGAVAMSWVDRLRACGQAWVETVRDYTTWRLLAPLHDRLYDWALSHLCTWPIGLARRRRGRQRGPRRIAYYVWRYPVLSQTFIARELAALAEAGVDVTVIADGRDYGPPAPADHVRTVERVHYLDPILPAQIGWNVAALAFRRPLRTANLLAYVVFRTYRRPKSIGDDIRTFLRAVRLASVLHAQGLDHVHAPWGNISAFIAMVAARLAGVGFSVQFRAHDLHRRTAAFLLAEKIRNADFVVTNSCFNQAYLQALAPPSDQPKIHRVYNGLDLERFDRSGRRAEPGRETRILSVARLIEAKGLVHLLEACATLRARGERFRCAIVGAPELPLYLNDYIEIQLVHRRLDLSDCVEFLGPLPLPRVIECYRRADIFVLPCVVAKDGSNDISPNALLEAMAMGLAVVSTTITAIPELVEHGVSGILAPPKDSVALAQAIGGLIGDSGLRRRLGENARKRIEKRFDVRANIRSYVELFSAS